MWNFLLKYLKQNDTRRQVTHKNNNRQSEGGRIPLQDGGQVGFRHIAISRIGAYRALYLEAGIESALPSYCFPSMSL